MAEQQERNKYGFPGSAAILIVLFCVSLPFVPACLCYGDAFFFNEVTLVLLDAESREPIFPADVHVTLLRNGDPLYYTGPTLAEGGVGGSYSAIIDEGWAGLCSQEPPADYGSPPDQAVVTVVHGERLGAVFLSIKPANIVESEDWDRQINLGTVEVTLEVR